MEKSSKKDELGFFLRWIDRLLGLAVLIERKRSNDYFSKDFRGNEFTKDDL